MANLLNAYIASGAGYEPPRFDYLNSTRVINLLKGEEADRELKRAALEIQQEEMGFRREEHDWQRSLFEFDKETRPMKKEMLALEMLEKEAPYITWQNYPVFRDSVINQMGLNPAVLPEPQAMEQAAKAQGVDPAAFFENEFKPKNLALMKERHETLKQAFELEKAKTGLEREKVGLERANVELGKAKAEDSGEGWPKVSMRMSEFEQKNWGKLRPDLRGTPEYIAKWNRDYPQVQLVATAEGYMEYDKRAGGFGEPTEVGKPPSSEMIDMEQKVGTMIDSLGRVKTTYDPSYIGPIEGRLGQVEQKLINIPKKQAGFYSDLEQIKNVIVYLYSGKQINESEFDRLMKQLPDANLPTNTFEARMDNFEALFESIVKHREPLMKAYKSAKDKQKTKKEGEGSTPKETTFDFPDPIANKDRTIRDTESGKRYQSDGTTWIEVK